MKIVFITHYSEMYGANKSLINLIEGLTFLYDIKPLVIIPYEGSIVSVLKEKNIKFVVLKFNLWSEKGQIKPINLYDFFKKKYFLWRKKKSLKSYNLEKLTVLKDELGDFDPDWIYSNSSVFDFGFLYAKKYNIKHLWHIREFGEKDYNSFFFDKREVTKSFNASDKVVAISNAIKDFYFKNFDIRNIVVKYNGVLSLYDLRKLDEKLAVKRVLPSSEMVFGIVGLIQKNKNQEEAIIAFKLVNDKYPKTKLLIVGQGNQEDLKKKAMELEIHSKVIFLGHLSNPFDAFLQMDLNLMCSRNEGLGRVTIEAMAAGIPTIGFNGGGTKEIIQENFTGVFYENGFKELSDKMIYFIENQKKLYEMGFNAKNVFTEKYTSEIYASNIFNLLTDNFQSLNLDRCNNL